MKYILLIFLLFFTLPFLLCQDPAYINYNVDVGLASNEVYDVLEDHNGYMWFATDKGISKYNGSEFKNFTIKDGLPDNTIFGLSEDHTGKIWLSSLNGMLSYVQNDSCHLVLEDHYFNQLEGIYVDVYDTIWLSCGIGQFKVYKSKEEGYSFDELHERYLFRQIDLTSNGVLTSSVKKDVDDDRLFYFMNGKRHSFKVSDVLSNEQIEKASNQGIFYI